jgi:methionine synthase II (cobalamin-independent)
MTRAVAAALFHAGAPVVQLAEDELTAIGADDYGRRALAAEAFDRATAGLVGHLSLSVAGGNADRAGPGLFFDAPFASYIFDLINGPDNWRLITQAPHDRGIVCGVADARSDAPDDEAVMIWAARYAASSEGRGVERVGLAPSAGLELLPRAVARRKIEGLAEAARKAGLPTADLAGAIDPRAVDARSGALGAFDPRAPRPAVPGRSRPGPSRPKPSRPER